MNLAPLAIQKFFTNDGIPLVGGKLFTYVAGTTTKLATYINSVGPPNTNTNPIILNFRGEASIWIDPTLSYKFTLAPATDTDPPTNPIWTVDNITAAPASMDNAALDTGSINAAQLSYPNLPSTPSIFTRIVWKSATQNSSAVTISINGGPIKALNWQNGQALSAGALQTNGMYEAIYDGSGWQLQGPALLPRYMITLDEFLSGVIPVDYSVPSYMEAGIIYPERYGAKGDASSNGQSGTDDTTALRNVATLLNQLGGGTVRFKPGAYYRIFSSTTGTLFSCTNLRGVSFLGNGATLVVPTNKSITASEGYLFYFSGCTDVFVDGFKTDGPTLDISNTAVKSYEFVHIEGGTKGVHLGVNRVKNMLAGLIAQNQTADLTETSPARCQDITIDNLYTENCWYTINLQNSGDHFVAHCLRSNGVHRTFFIYGVQDVEAEIYSKDHKSVDLLLNTGSGSYRNKDWRVTYHSSRDSNACSTGAAKVQILLAGETAQFLDGVKIQMNVDYPTSGSNNGGAAFEIHKVKNDGSSASLDYGHILNNVVVSGSILGQGANVNGSATMCSNNGATWGTGDFFSNIIFRDLRIQPTNDDGVPAFIFGNVTDQIVLDNVVCTNSISIRDANATNELPRAPRLELKSVKCTNLWVNDAVGAGTAVALSLITAPSATSTAYAGWANGKLLTNHNTGATTWTLPVSVPGMIIQGLQDGAGRLRLDPNGSEVVQGGTAGQNYYTDSTNGTTELECVNAGTWVINRQVGTWAYGG